MNRHGSIFALGLILLGSGLLAATFGLWRHSITASVAEPDLAAAARADLERRHFQPLSQSLQSLLNDPTYRSVPTQVHPLLGQRVPDFRLKDTEDRIWSLTETLRRGPVVLVFYYGYHCDHCVSQLFGLNEDVAQFSELGAQLLAISEDPPELTRERFRQYGAFRFPVLSDPANAVARQYGTYAPPEKPDDKGELLHGTFVIAPDGHLIWANRGDSPFVENRTLLVELNRFRR